MSADARNGGSSSGKTESLTTPGGFITYRRRKRPGQGTGSALLGDPSVSTALQKCKKRLHDVGWEHGEVVNGNRFHWKCKWCGHSRRSGGACRLKMHIAGGYDVLACQKVPKDVAHAMRRFLRRRHKEREEKRARRREIDKVVLEGVQMKCKKRLHDVGWEHGEVVNGNRFHWKCKWCGHSRRSGGACRLKMHIAGGYNVLACQKVPKDVAHAMRRLLRRRHKEREEKRARHREIDKLVLEDPHDSGDRDEGHGFFDFEKLHTPIAAQQSGEEQLEGVQMKCNKRLRDVGWVHGEVVDGNPFHWKCKWCGYSLRRCRLKLHIAGGYDVRACQKVPKDVAHAMRRLLRRRRKEREEKRARRREIDKLVLEYPHDSGYRDEGHSQREKLHTPIAAQQSGEEQSEGVQMSMKQPHYMMLCNEAYELCGLSTLERSWRNILEHLLQSPGLSDGAGIRSCIQKALASGILGFTSKLNMHGAQTKDSCKDYCEFEGEAERPKGSWSAGKHKETALDGFQKYPNDQEDACVITKKCQDVLYDILVSERFASLCDSLCRNFPGCKAYSIVDLSLIESRMKSGVYEQSPGLFDQDIQQVWVKIQKSSQETALHATSLSNISRTSYKSLVGEDSVLAVGEWKYEGTNQVGAEEKNSMDSYTTAQFPSYESDRSTKPDQTEASCLYKVCTCKQCGTEADGKHSLICDGCEAVYHVSCIKPAVQGIPKQSWYCAACSSIRRKLAEPDLINTHEDCLHQNCVVCDRLKNTRTQECLNDSSRETVMVSGSRESSVSSMESDESPQPSKAAISSLCKQCGTGEDEDKRFLICGNTHCFYKYYHIRCLKSTQLASQQQRHQRCWYCPSCLCRACLSDRDDDKIVLCDGCDEAYHTYCMKPPRATVPEGKWYCVSCNIARARQGMRRYEHWVLQHHRKENIKLSNGANRSMDMLVIAAEKLSSEEKLAVVRKSR